MREKIKETIATSIAVKQEILNNDLLLGKIEKAVELIVAAYRTDKKVLLCGNGGSAADALHLACEFSGRFFLDRKALFAEALNVNTPSLTAIANDYSYEEVYARLLEAKGRKGDVFVAISTSGNSPNVLKAVAKAKEIGMQTIAMTGKCGGDIVGLSPEIILNPPSKITPRVQEAHILIGHIICELVEKELFSN